MILSDRFKYLPWIWTGGVAAVLTILLGRYGYDDPYITFRYAQNLAHGIGFVYNQGERILSTTTPLYTVFLATAQLFGIDVPYFSNLTGSVSLALGGLAFWELGQAWRTWVVGLVGLLVYPLFPILVQSISSETPLYLALILFGFLAYARERYIATAVLLALAALIRADGVLAAGAAGCAFLIQHRRPIPWHAIGLYLLLLAPWFIFAQFYFGAPLPATLAAKRRQGLLSASELFFAGLVRRARNEYWAYLLQRPQAILALIGSVFTYFYARPWLLIVGWSLLYIAAYTALGVTSYFWYYGPVAVGFIALVGIGVAAIFQHGRRLLKRPWAATLMLVLLLITILIPELNALRYTTTHPDTRLEIYRTTGEWLRGHTPMDASIGVLEVGIIGYYAERRMIDFAGLLQPEVGLQLSPTTGYDDAAVWAFQRFRPDYLVLQSDALPRLEHNVAGANGCSVIQTFQDPHYAFPLLIFACPNA